jgi:hypothetical protein
MAWIPIFSGGVMNDYDSPGSEAALEEVPCSEIQIQFALPKP